MPPQKKPKKKPPVISSNYGIAAGLEFSLELLSNNADNMLEKINDRTKRVEDTGVMVVLASRLADQALQVLVQAHSLHVAKTLRKNKKIV